MRVMTIKIDQNVLSDLGKEHALPLLEVLFMRGWMISSEVARELSIHISTAQTYLESLRKNDVIQSRFRNRRSGPIEYSLQDPIIQVNIDLKQIISKKIKEAKKKAHYFLIKEKKKNNISYEWNEDERKILAINFLEKSKKFGRITVSHTLYLTNIEGKFLWNLPQSTEKSKTVLQIAGEADLRKDVDLIKIIDLVEMLEREKIIIITR
jgi:predicted transcriptional regulator